MTKSTITRADAIAIAMERTTDLPEVHEVLKNMHVQLTKPRAKAVSKARLANENLAKKAVEFIGPDGITTKQLVNCGIPEIMTTQKASAVLRVAVDLGLAEKVEDKKKVSYKRVVMAE